MVVRVIIDERERNSRIPELLRRAGASVEFAFLTVGDYIVSSQTAIERKTITDLINSIYDGRLFLQCNDLVRNYLRPVIVVEGTLSNLQQDQYSQIINGDDTKSPIEQLPLIYEALTRVVLEFRIPIIPTPTSEYTSRLLIMIANQARKEGFNDGPLLKRIRKQNPMYVQQLSVLSSLPGVGDKTAIRMLKKFRTPARTLTASVAELAMISGLGTNRAIRIRRILDSPSGAKDAQTEIQKTLGDSSGEDIR